MNFKKLLIAILFTTLILSSCSNLPSVTTSTSALQQSTTPLVVETETPLTASADSTVTSTPFQPVIEPKMALIYWSPAIPQEWVQDFGGLLMTQNPAEADLRLMTEPTAAGSVVFGSFERVFAIAAPFPTVTDGVSLTDIQAIWQGSTSSTGEFSRLIMTEATKMTFSELWGAPGDHSIGLFNQVEIVNEVWNSTNTLALIPFENIEPKFKILRVDEISPLDRPMNLADYPLTVTYTLTGNEGVRETLQGEIAQILTLIPATNRDESKMTIVVMSGTTALARVTLKKIELNGYDYPVEMIKDWFLSADLRHVSNEVAFIDYCEFTDAFTMQFCSKVDQIKVLENLGVNVVESTGNHMKDYGEEAFTETLRMYEERGWLSFGGGFDFESARQPATTEVNGNKIAFIGCNPSGPVTVWATETSSGAAECDFVWFDQKISELKSQGYVVIATFQETEIELPMYDEYYRTAFKDAASAGADIVQGSQAHAPMGFEFVGDNLIHYGLGNLLFDQMEPENVREFIDRHVIYDGRYISTELLTAVLTDWCRPVPMNETRRHNFLEEIFSASNMR